jgi:hypothetical protein
METIEINVPTGLSVDGQWCRNVLLQPLTGYEEEFLLQEGKSLSAAARVTHLLTRCVRRLGCLDPVGADTVRRLNVGDREALLLHLRRLALGERVSCLLSCPSCSKKMDLELQLQELLLPAYAEAKSSYCAKIGAGSEVYDVTFRLPNGYDQEAVAPLADDSVDSAAEVLLQRCIQGITTASGDKVAETPAIVLRELPQKMAELDPQAEILLNLRCPECEVQFVVPFDTTDYLCREINESEYDFYRQVHSLSFHYHWKEDAILAMTRRKRQIYLTLLADEISGGKSK